MTANDDQGEFVLDYVDITLNDVDPAVFAAPGE